jgi:hypothetical protein
MGAGCIILIDSAVTAFLSPEDWFHKEGVLFRHLTEVKIVDLLVDISSKLKYLIAELIFSLRSLPRKFPKVNDRLLKSRESFHRIQSSIFYIRMAIAGMIKSISAVLVGYWA